MLSHCISQSSFDAHFDLLRPQTRKSLLFPSQAKSTLSSSPRLAPVNYDACKILWYVLHVVSLSLGIEVAEEEYSRHEIEGQPKR